MAYRTGAATGSGPLQPTTSVCWGPDVMTICASRNLPTLLQVMIAISALGLGCGSSTPEVGGAPGLSGDGDGGDDEPADSTSGTSDSADSPGGDDDGGSSSSSSGGSSGDGTSRDEPPKMVEFESAADTLVRVAEPESNFGDYEWMSAATGPDVVSLVRFDIQDAGVIERAILRFRVRNTSNDGMHVYSSRSPWLEDTVTWNTQPDRGMFLGTLGAVEHGDAIDLDVSDYVKEDGSYDVAMVGAGPDNLAVKSRESDDPPRLIVNPTSTVERKFDVDSQTHYYLTRISHSNDGKLLKLEHAQATEQNGETIPDFAARIGGPQVAINASMGQVGLPDGTREPVGIQIVDGVIIQEVPTATRVFTLGIRDDNELVAYPFGTTAREILEDGVNDALTAFIPLIEDHEIVSDEVLDTVGNLSEKNPRQVIAQFDNLDLMILSCGGRGIDGEGMTALDLIRVLQTYDVKFAFNLDGGGSVATVVNGDLVTKRIDGNGTLHRPRPNFLYVE